jgi:arylsulfatase A-like enzyme
VGHTRIRRLVIVFVALVVAITAASCVTPTPPPGAPVPAIQFTLSQPSPVTGPFTVTATPLNFTPAALEFTLDGAKSATVDDEAPYELHLDATSMAFGHHSLTVQGHDDTYHVAYPFDFDVDGPPNIVMVLTDDLDQMVSPFWDAMPKTKALLADNGLTFEDSFAPDPICCPARATILTGKYGHNSGVLDITPPDGGYGAFVGHGENDTIATRLRAAGWLTGYYGKYLNGYESDPTHVPPGWAHWFGLTGTFYDGYTYGANDNGTMRTYGDADTDYQTDVLTAESTKFIQSAEKSDGNPFLLFVAPTAPHWPMPPAPRHATNPFQAYSQPAAPNDDEADVSDKPSWLRDGVPNLGYNQLLGNVIDYQYRLGSLMAVDDMVSSIVSTLQATHELDKTYLVFTSDNGYNLGAHRLLSKMAPYEESIRVPLVVRGPGVVTGTDTHIVAQQDFAPTFLDIAGVPIPDAMDGRSFLPLLHGQSTAWRSDLLAEYNNTDFFGATLDTRADVANAIAAGTFISVPTYRALRTEQYLYVQWYRGSDHEYELYDLDNDPYELDNLIATPDGAAAHADVTALLQNRLTQLASCVGTSCRD